MWEIRIKKDLAISKNCLIFIKIKIKVMFWTYYVICVIYCFYQLFTKYQERYNDGMIGLNPGLDSIMVVILAWVLAPIDFGLTWISWYKKAEEARRRQFNIDFKISEEDNIY